MKISGSNLFSKAAEKVFMISFISLLVEVIARLGHLFMQPQQAITLLPCSDDDQLVFGSL